jgi:hypothetical protein
MLDQGSRSENSNSDSGIGERGGLKFINPTSFAGMPWQIINWETIDSQPLPWHNPIPNRVRLISLMFL